jgi:MFS family permease
VNAAQWKVLAAATLGWALDGMDVMLYAFALTSIQKEFGFTSAVAGAIASATLVGSGFGGLLFGHIADRFGRTRALIFSILSYSIFTAATASSSTLAHLFFWRLMVGIGLGGEWAAGSVLVAETWPAEHRGKAIGIVQSGWAIGYIIAAVLAAVVLPHHGWRVLFVIGVAPALFTVWVWRSIPEPEVWKQRAAVRKPRNMLAGLATLLRPPLLRNTLVASLLGSALMFAYWGLFTWIPAFLASSPSRGGAGLNIFHSASWIVAMQTGAFFGYISFGFFADRIGRRWAFVIFVLAAAAIVPIYGLAARSALLLLILGPALGFFGHGYFSVFGAMLAELFPLEVRGVAQGLCYNIGRSISALAPATIGFLADRHGLGSALACTSVLYVFGAFLMMLLPETKGKSLQ